MKEFLLVAGNLISLAFNATIMATAPREASAKRGFCSIDTHMRPDIIEPQHLAWFRPREGHLLANGLSMLPLYDIISLRHPAWPRALRGFRYGVLV